jgi:hypothetical protein
MSLSAYPDSNGCEVGFKSKRPLKSKEGKGTERGVVWRNEVGRRGTDVVGSDQWTAGERERDLGG